MKSKSNIGKCFLSFLLISIISSCRITGLTNDYEKLSDKQKGIILKFKDSSTKLTNGYIYEINATQLKELIKKHDKAMVYIFTNGCSLKDCKPLNYYVDFAKKNNYKLFLVMTGYGNLQQTIEQKVDIPFFSIDSKYYSTNIRKYYTQYFENELLDKPKNENLNIRGNIYIFEKGNFVIVLNDL